MIERTEEQEKDVEVQLEARLAHCYFRKFQNSIECKVLSAYWKLYILNTEDNT